MRLIIYFPTPATDFYRPATCDSDRHGSLLFQFVRGNKSDYRDAITIGEAACRPDIRSVPVKTLEQQDIQSLHRIRERHVRQRTGLMNQTRGLLSEYGIIAPQGHKAFCHLMADIYDSAYASLSPILTAELTQVMAEYRMHTQRIQAIELYVLEIFITGPLRASSTDRKQKTPSH